MLTKEEKQIILERRYTASFYAPWADATLFQMIVENVAEPFRDTNIKKVLGLEARGFILGRRLPTCFTLVSSLHAKAGNLYKGSLCFLNEFSSILALTIWSKEDP